MMKDRIKDILVLYHTSFLSTLAKRIVQVITFFCGFFLSLVIIYYGGNIIFSFVRGPVQFIFLFLVIGMSVGTISYLINKDGHDFISDAVRFALIFLGLCIVYFLIIVFSESWGVSWVEFIEFQARTKRVLDN